MFPGPLFKSASYIEVNAARATGDIPMDFADPQTIELGMQAQYAMNTLSDRSQKKIAQEYLVHARATANSKVTREGASPTQFFSSTGR